MIQVINKIILGSIITSSIAYATSSVELNVNNNTLELEAKLDIKDKFQLNNDSNYNFIISALTTKENNGIQDSSSLYTAGLEIVNPYVSNNGLSFGLGVKVVYADNSDTTFTAIPLTVFAKYEVNEKFFVDANVAYAPSILTFSNAERYSDYKIKANYNVMSNAYVFLGLRQITTEYEKLGKLKYDDSIFIGYKIQF
jgi:lipopolysaccharide assembly outer membrane protein LptD (OstA)